MRTEYSTTENIIISLPAGLAAWIRPRAWLRVQPAQQAGLATKAGKLAYEIFKIPPGMDESHVMDLLSRSGAGTPLVTSGYLPRSLREALERRGVAYLDAKGHVHLPWPGGLVHIDEPAREHKAAVSGHLGVHGVRAVQAILDEPNEILVTGLAASVELSVSRAHSILTLLETEGLVRSTGRGPSTRRHVVNRTQLLDWLVAQPAARRREKQLDVALYARTPGEAWKRLRQRLDEASIPHALTGSAAAAVLGAGPTSMMVSAVRISPEVTLEDAARALQAQVADRGANVRLIRDTGRVGSVRSREHHEVRIASPVRIYLDALAERRGEDVAQQFREVVLGY